MSNTSQREKVIPAITPTVSVSTILYKAGGRGLIAYISPDQNTRALHKLDTAATRDMLILAELALATGDVGTAIRACGAAWVRLTSSEEATAPVDCQEDQA